MIENLDIAGYCRISVDEEQDRDNTSIENQKAIIEDFVVHRFPNSTLTFYEDRDRSGYTFEQREGYQAMRRELMSHRKNILIIKDFSRFSRRNSRGLVELEDLRDAGVRIISIGDNIDFPNDDDWLKIQFHADVPHQSQPHKTHRYAYSKLLESEQAKSVSPSAILNPVRHPSPINQRKFRTPSSHHVNSVPYRPAQTQSYSAS